MYWCFIWLRQISVLTLNSVIDIGCEMGGDVDDRIVNNLRLFVVGIFKIFLLLGTKLTSSAPLVMSVAFNGCAYNTPSSSSPLQCSTLPKGSTSCGDVGITSHSIANLLSIRSTLWNYTSKINHSTIRSILFIHSKSYCIQYSVHYIKWNPMKNLKNGQNIVPRNEHKKIWQPLHDV